MAQQNTPKWGLAYGWSLGENGWNIGMDANVQMLEVLLGTSVISNALATPPASPVAGDQYIVAASGTGAWLGKDNQLAAWIGGAWKFFVPKRGVRVEVQNLGGFFSYNGTNWVAENPILGASGSAHTAGRAPDPGPVNGATKFLREDATWAQPPYPPVMSASGVGHAGGLVPDPGGAAGTTNFLREDGTWATPSGTGGGGGATRFIDLTDTFSSYAGRGGQGLRVKLDESGVEAAADAFATPKASDFPYTFNHNCSVSNCGDGLTFDGGSPVAGDVAGAVCKSVPAGEFEFEAFLKSCRAVTGNWAGLGIGVYGGGTYYFNAIRYDATPRIVAAKNSDLGGHVDILFLADNGPIAFATGGWHKFRRFKPSPANLTIGINLAVGATDCAFTGWTSQRAQNFAGASGCLSTVTGLAPSTSLNITATSSVAANQSLNVVPINSVDGTTPPTLRATDSASGTWSSINVPLPAGTLAGDAIIIGIRHQMGVLFDDIQNWNIIGNFNGINSDGSSLCVSKVLTAADIAAGSVAFRSTAVGNGCYFTAVVQGGTYASIGIPMTVQASGTSNSMSSDNIQLMYSADRIWWELMSLTAYSAYFAAPPTHAGFCVGWNRSSGLASIICRSWKQSW